MFFLNAISWKEKLLKIVKELSDWLFLALTNIQYSGMYVYHISKHMHACNHHMISDQMTRMAFKFIYDIMPQIVWSVLLIRNCEHGVV